MQEKQSARLTIPQKDGSELVVSLPIIDGSCGPSVLDISNLYEKTGFFAHDPGFTSTSSCTSKITFIDGNKGELLYRGYDASELAKKCTFLEVAYLILRGELPDSAEFQDFEEKIKHHTIIHEQMINFYQGFRRDAHPMAIMVAVVGALSSFYHDSLDIKDPEQREIASFRIISKMPTMAAMAYKYANGHPFVYPLNSLSYAGNFLHMMFKLPTEDYIVNQVCERSLDQILILHADHEQNASTSTVRLAGSSCANPFACVASGIASLWGPAHGGANEEVLKMLKRIGDKKNIPAVIKQAKEKDGPRLMGFGHRVYKNFDPRALLLRERCKELLEALNIKDDPLLEIALELEKIALNDEYFIKKKLYPNVDFYSGIMLKAMGIPTSMFTVLFSVARSVGWVAQWQEMLKDPKQKIGRPRQLYLGHKKREFVPIEERSKS